MDCVQLALLEGQSKAKQGTVVEVCEITSQLSSNSDDDSKQSLEQPIARVQSIPYRRPNVNWWAKSKEVVRMSYTRTKVSINDRNTGWRPISQPQRFSHYYVESLISRKGKNDRTLLGACHAVTDVQDGQGKLQRVVHAASHNYAGFYRSNEQSENLQRLCLDSLPVNKSSVVCRLEKELHSKIADLFQTDFCYTTSTGYGSNLLAFPALLSSRSLIILDEKCHNSMFIGAFLNEPARIRKFGHNDMNQLESFLQEDTSRYDKVVVAIEGLYSMDGTTPPLGRLADLKDEYGFILLADEAHSLLCLGRTGRGCVEHWNDTHPDHGLSLDLFDIRTATLSKACGAIGGAVFGVSRFKQAVEVQRKKLSARGSESLNPAAIVQTINVLDQPTRLSRQLQRLRSITAHTRAELQRFGIYVYGDAETPVLPIHAGRPSLAAKLSYTLRKLGILATPIATPAVPYWEARVRVSLSADHDDRSVDDLIAALIQGCYMVGIIPHSKLRQNKLSYHDIEPSKQEEIEADLSYQRLEYLIQQDVALMSEVPKPSHGVIQAGHKARKQHGLPSGAPRWTTGTFSTHLDAEKRLADAVGMPDAMTYPDSYLGLISTLAALCRPIIGYETHHLFISNKATPAVLDGLRIAPKSGLPVVERYGDVGTLVQQINKLSNRSAYITLYIDLSDFSNNENTALEALEQWGSAKGSMTILFNDSSPPGNSTRRHIYLTAQSMGAEVLVFGSFADSMKLPGAYLAGSNYLLNELRYTSRGYMFSTSQMPFIMGMVAESVKVPT